MRFLLILLMVSSLILISGCSRNVQVEDIVSNPSQYVNKTVSIREGSTSDAFWLSDRNTGAYKIYGVTGVEIWVVTARTPPLPLEVVRIRGEVTGNYTLGDVSLGTVIIERNRRLIYHYPLPADKSSTSTK